MAAKKTVVKVSGLVSAGKLGPVSAEAVERMPVFETGPAERVLRLPIARIRPSRYQNRLVHQEARIAELAENIRADGLHHPIVVRPLAGGDYELIAGENRLNAFRQLGETEIPARIREMDEPQAARATVLDNFFHHPLSDYEIYRGLSILLDTAAVSVRALSQATPYSKSQIQRLMAFGKLPPAALVLLDIQPDLIGANTAEALAGCVAQGYGEDVVRALEQIRDGTLRQTRAPAWIISQYRPKAPALRRKWVKATGGKPYASLVRDGRSLRIRAAAGVDLDRLEQAVLEVLQRQAEAAD